MTGPRPRREAGRSLPSRPAPAPSRPRPPSIAGGLPPPDATSCRWRGAAVAIAAPAGRGRLPRRPGPGECGGGGDRVHHGKRWLLRRAARVAAGRPPRGETCVGRRVLVRGRRGRGPGVAGMRRRGRAWRASAPGPTSRPAPRPAPRAPLPRAGLGNEHRQRRVGSSGGSGARAGAVAKRTAPRGRGGAPRDRAQRERGLRRAAAPAGYVGAGGARGRYPGGAGMGRW